MVATSAQANGVRQGPRLRTSDRPASGTAVVRTGARSRSRTENVRRAADGQIKVQGRPIVAGRGAVGARRPTGLCIGTAHARVTSAGDAEASNNGEVANLASCSLDCLG